MPDSPTPQPSKPASDYHWLPENVSEMSSDSPKMQAVYEDIKTVAATDATVLVNGESGTGKGLIARLIHRLSNRFGRPFVGVHCGAIPDSLIESILFGHVKGAFTGAVNEKLGKFLAANTGTIFLDEIGTMTPTSQIRLSYET